MIALLLAAGTAFLPNPFPSSSSATACKAPMTMQTSFADPVLLLRPQDRAVSQAKRLTELPKANLEYAVMRTVGGCVVPSVVRYDAEGDGHVAGGGSK
ncbi:hypothetical protein [Phenylobacterium sp.]|uniref:hypothetical protein n=1 Tax=Phenylobacterium sp. TaxID=1871053 RepID=UPI00374D7B7F